MKGRLFALRFSMMHLVPAWLHSVVRRHDHQQHWDSVCPLPMAAAFFLIRTTAVYPSA